ncbi:MAG TPA: DNA polymerase Y family protein [Terriglobales bacterium]|nr:DNA polymerase Y family protein [Terriglobales bacterium]
MDSMLFACLYIPDFPVQAVVRSTPELRDRAVAILDGSPPLLSVIAVNARARELGIQVGMTKAQAEPCPDLCLRTHARDQEQAAHAALLDCARAFSPRVEDTNRRNAEAASSKMGDTVLLDITGLDRLLGSPAKLARDLQVQVADIGMRANIGVAGNPDAAMHAARGFVGIMVIEPGGEGRKLGPLPLSLLEPSSEILETLELWGIRDFRALAALPEVALSQRLGQEGLRLQQLARGRAQRALIPCEPAMDFKEILELEDPVELLDPMAFLLNRLLDQICVRLRSRALGATALHLTLHLAEHCDQTTEEQASSKRVHRRTLEFPVPIQDSRTFLKLLELDLAAHPPGAPVKNIEIVAQPALPRFAQSGLFVLRGPEPARLELTLARLRGLVGEDRVGSTELLDTHAPEAFRMCRFRPGTKESRDLAPRSNSAPRAAMRVFRPPLEAKVQLKNGAPSQVMLRGRPHQVTAAAGPWRHSGGWWTPQTWTREEWDLELRAQDSFPILVRMFRDLSSAKWRVEGTFD